MAASESRRANDDHRTPVGQVAARTLRTHFDTLWTELLAACTTPDQTEHVHRLRVATRRTLAAIEAFQRVIPAKRRDWFAKRLRRLRRVAGEARDLDVLTDRLAKEDPARARRRLIAMLSKQRHQSITPIRTQLKKLKAADWPGRVDRLLDDVRDRRRQWGFRAFARRRFKPMVAAFFEKADRTLRQNDEIHTLRIEGKKLRYTLEIFAPVFPGRAQVRCLESLERLQKTLGTFTDHASAADRFDRWAGSAAAGPNRDVLVSLRDEEKAQAVVARKAFCKWWNHTRRRALRRRFDRTLRRSA